MRRDVVLEADGSELVGTAAVSAQGGRIHEPPSLSPTHPFRRRTTLRLADFGGKWSGRPVNSGTRLEAAPYACLYQLRFMDKNI
jgi:hypothetical protein